MSDDSTAVLQGQLERVLTGDDEARQRLLELTYHRLMGHARRFLHGRYARLEPFAQTDDVVQQLYLKILQTDCLWIKADGEPVRTLAERFGHTSAWMRDVLCDLLRKEYGRREKRGRRSGETEAAAQFFRGYVATGVMRLSQLEKNERVPPRVGSAWYWATVPV